MGMRFFFELKELPDFTLTKYQAVNISDLNSVVRNNAVFLKQLHSLGLVSGLSFHLFYSFLPSMPEWRKLQIILMAERSGDGVDITADSLSQIISSFANAQCFCFTQVPEDKQNDLIDLSYKYSCFCTIAKKEYLTNPNYSGDEAANGMKYYSISEWKARQGARMYNSLKLLVKYSAPTVLRIDIYPVSDPNKILNDISRRGIYSKVQAQAAFRAVSPESGIGMSRRDEAASRVNSFYDSYFKTMSASLQFNASVNVFSDTEANCRLLGDVLCSEVLEKGLISQCCEKGAFSADHRLDAHIPPKVSIFDDDGNKVPEMTNCFTIEEIAPFFSFPYLYPGEDIGIRKETDPVLSNSGMRLGKNTAGYDVSIPYDVFAKHAYISGVPGSGKTFTMKHIIHTLSRAGIPFLVFEPAKREYRGLYDVDCDDPTGLDPRDKTDDIILLCPKTNSLFPLHINPFIIPDGVSVNDYIDVLFDVFKGAFSWPQPTPMILKRSIIRAYRKHGLYGSLVMTSELAEKTDFPNMNDIYEAFQWIMDNDSSYRGEAHGNIKGVLETRIGSLMEGNIGEVFNPGISTIRPENWNKLKIIMELENLSGEHANFITLLIISLIRLELKKDPGMSTISDTDPRRELKLRHVIFFEEAHNLIGRISEASDEDGANSKIASTAFIKAMLAEVRAYGQGIVIADQLPTAIAPEVLKNTSIKIAHKQTAEDEREAIGSVMSADGIQLEKLAKFDKGECLITFDGVLKPFEMHIESRFKYSSDAREDIPLAKQFAASSRWYQTIIFHHSLKPRHDAAVNKLRDLNDIKYGLSAKFDALITSAEQCVSGGTAMDAGSLDQLRYADGLFKHCRSDSEKVLDELHEIQYVTDQIINNSISGMERFSDLSGKISNDIEAAERIRDRTGEICGMFEACINKIKSER